MATATGRWNKYRVEAVFFGVAIVSLLYLLRCHHPGTEVTEPPSEPRCDFPAIFNFGDSNSDTGTVSAAFGRVVAPHGKSFFGGPAGRFSDGRLVIDFLAEELGLPYLSAYLDSIGSNFTNGANFAAAGSTIKPHASMSPLDLGKQLSQLDQFKSRSIELYNLDSSDSETSSCIKSILPRTEYFSKALYTMDTGQNDLHHGLKTMTEEQVTKSIPSIIDQLALSIERLYQYGARAFWIHNTGPIGCLPYFVINYPPKPENTDPIGCIESYNEVAREFNNQLKNKVSQLSNRLKDALLVYVDIYTAKYSLISGAKEYGFVDPLGFCCGLQGADCGEKVLLNGSEVYGAACEKPHQFISWDNIHYTESANHWIAKHIVNGSFSDPKVPIFESCKWLPTKISVPSV